MSRLDEIAGQGPVAWWNPKYPTLPVQLTKPYAGGHWEPIFTQDPHPLVALIRQMEAAIKYYDFANGVPQAALSALTEFDKGEG